MHILLNNQQYYRVIELYGRIHYDILHVLHYVILNYQINTINKIKNKYNCKSEKQ